jgi:hypothetical protein
MFIVSKILKRTYIRRVLFVLIFLALIGWLFNGYTISSDYLGKRLNKNSTYVQETMEKLAKINPEAAMSLAKFLEGKNTNAVGASLQFEEQQSGHSAIRVLATRSLNNPDNPLPWYDLANIATNSKLINGPEEMKTFLSAHSMAYGLVFDSGDRTVSDWYDKKLREASEGDKSKWFIIKNDPMALLIWSILGDSHPDLWDFYAMESDWLSEALLLLTPANNLEELENINSIDASFLWIPEVLEGLKKYHPLGKDIYLETVNRSEGAPDSELYDEFAEASLLLTGLLKYGDIVAKVTANNSGILASDALELILLNPEIFEPPENDNLVNDWAIKHSAYLINLQKSRPAVWAAAHMRPQVLWLDKIAPHVSESLIINHGADDVQIFLFDIFDEDIDVEKAAEAIDRFGDLAISIFNYYQTNPDLALSLRKYGPRIVPFLSIKGSKGFELLSEKEGQNWLNNYFDEHGNERSEEWITAVPFIGGPAGVINNLVKGYPSTWDELGWAALDIADAALLVASLGTSAPVTAAKQTAKTSVKLITKPITKRGVRTTLSTVGAQGRKVAASDFTRRITQYGTRRASSGKSTLFRTLAKAKYLTVTNVSVAVWKTLLMVKKAWTNIPPQYRKTILKALTFVAFLYRVVEHSKPILAEILSEKLDSLPDALNNLFTKFVDKFNEIIAAILSAGSPSFAQSPNLVFVFGIFILVFLLYISRPNPVGLKRG